MLQCKDIKKISELKKRFYPPLRRTGFISHSLKCFIFSNLCNSISPIKIRGYSLEWIITFLLSIPFLNAITINSKLTGCVKHLIKTGKVTFYRPKNNPGIS
jgi:hypothetical protein